MNKLQENLAYIVKYGNGRINNLIENIGEDVVHQFESIGFINNGCNITWSKTPLADKYYKDVFGLFSFYKLKFF